MSVCTENKFHLVAVWSLKNQSSIFFKFVSEEEEKRNHCKENRSPELRDYSYTGGETLYHHDCSITIYDIFAKYFFYKPEFPSNIQIYQTTLNHNTV